jgi:hypothetical protein
MSDFIRANNRRNRSLFYYLNQVDKIEFTTRNIKKKMLCFLVLLFFSKLNWLII